MKKEGVDDVNNNESWFRGFLIRLEVLNDKTASVVDSFFVSNEESGDVKVYPAMATCTGWREVRPANCRLER